MYDHHMDGVPAIVRVDGDIGEDHVHMDLDDDSLAMKQQT